MPFTIKRATWGDENGGTDVTSQIATQAASGYVDMPADQTLVPYTTIVDDVNLTEEEKATLRKEAVDACKGDRNCEKNILDAKTNALITKKMAETADLGRAIVGRRLTVTIVEDGKERTIQVPDGNRLTLGQKPVSAQVSESVKLSMPSGIGEVLLGGFSASSTFVRILGPIALFYFIRKLPWGLPVGTPYLRFPWGFLPGFDTRVNYAWLSVIVMSFLTEPGMAIANTYLPTVVSSVSGWIVFGFYIVALLALHIVHRKYFSNADTPSLFAAIVNAKTKLPKV